MVGIAVLSILILFLIFNILEIDIYAFFFIFLSHLIFYEIKYLNFSYLLIKYRFI